MLPESTRLSCLLLLVVLVPFEGFQVSKPVTRQLIPPPHTCMIEAFIAAGSSLLCGRKHVYMSNSNSRAAYLLT